MESEQEALGNAIIKLKKQFPQSTASERADILQGLAKTAHNLNGHKSA